MGHCEDTVDREPVSSNGAGAAGCQPGSTPHCTPVACPMRFEFAQPPECRCHFQKTTARKSRSELHGEWFSVAEDYRERLYYGFDLRLVHFLGEHCLQRRFVLSWLLPQ